MGYFVYNVLLLAASPAILFILLAKKRCRRGLPQRLGLRRPHVGSSPQGTIWVHAVSLGEVTAISPLVRELSARHPGVRIVVTTVTETGREAVEQRLAGVAAHAYAPLDFPWAVRRFVAALQPSVFLFVETELWPNLLRALSRARVPTILVNGRLSSASFRGYRLIKGFMRQVLRHVSQALMQTARDAERLVALGADPDRVMRTGNLKFDQPVPPDGGEGASIPALVSADEELIVAGSTHPGEEEELLECYRTLHPRFPSLVLLLAPRHIERAGEVEAKARALGFPVTRRSALSAQGGAPAARPRVVILDTRGELALIYRRAVVAYVGGTLIPVGGHNLLEPALRGKGVFFGPHTDHCAEVADLLIQGGGGRRVTSGMELAMAVKDCLMDRSALERMGRAARAVVVDNRGALEQSLAMIGKVLAAGHAER